MDSSKVAVNYAAEPLAVNAQTAALLDTGHGSGWSGPSVGTESIGSVMARDPLNLRSDLIRTSNEDPGGGEISLFCSDCNGGGLGGTVYLSTYDPRVPVDNGGVVPVRGTGGGGGGLITSFLESPVRGPTSETQPKSSSGTPPTTSQNLDSLLYSTLGNILQNSNAGAANPVEVSKVAAPSSKGVSPGLILVLGVVGVGGFFAYKHFKKGA